MKENDIREDMNGIKSEILPAWFVQTFVFVQTYGYKTDLSME